MASLKDIYEYIDSKYPYCIQESFDNSGIIVDCGRDIKKVVVSLDITTSVVKYASSVGAELILTHHPVIFNAIKSIEYKSAVYELISNEISGMCAHTNFDIAQGGVNDQLAQRLGLRDISEVFYISSGEIGGKERRNYIGRAGTTERELTPREFAAFAAERLGIPNIQYADGGKPINRVAVGGGACGEYIFECEANGIDAFVSGEAKHHELIYAVEHGITLVVGGHYATESVALPKLAQTVKEGFPELEVDVIYIDNPVSYVNLQEV